MNPEKVQADLLKLVRADPLVHKYLGEGITSGAFKAYSFPGKDKEKFPMTLINSLPFMNQRRMQILFQVSTDTASGMVSADILSKSRKGYVFKSLAVDVDKDRLVLKGDPADVVFKGIIRLR